MKYNCGCYYNLLISPPLNVEGANFEFTLAPIEKINK